MPSSPWVIFVRGIHDAYAVESFHETFDAAMTKLSSFEGAWFWDFPPNAIWKGDRHVTRLPQHVFYDMKSLRGDQPAPTESEADRQNSEVFDRSA